MIVKCKNERVRFFAGLSIQSRELASTRQVHPFRQGGPPGSGLEERPQVLDERHVPLLDRKLRPFRGLIEFPAQCVKNHQSAGGSRRRAKSEFLDPSVCLACGSRAHQDGRELSDDRV